MLAAALTTTRRSRGREPRWALFLRGDTVASVHNFSYGLLNPGLGLAMSCLGSFLGLRCVILARAYEGFTRARWLILAAISLGAIGIWAMHFIAMLGFTVPGQPLLYDVPLTIGSMVLAVAVVGVGLFIVGFGNGSWPRLVTGGTIIGLGVAGMHYLGMAAMSMTGTMSFNLPLVAVSVVIAIVAGTAALWIGTWVSGVGATIGAAAVMGVAVSAMHYTGMAALKVSDASMSAMAGVGGVQRVSGATASSFVIPLLAVLCIVTFVLMMAIAMTPSEGEIVADREMRARLELLERR
jgi:NO-binding membrane sensor protein with MHYT domain